jgi:hypothetical protein
MSLGISKLILNQLYVNILKQKIGNEKTKTNSAYPSGWKQSGGLS